MQMYRVILKVNNIELIGNTDLDFFLTGDLKKFNFNFKLSSNLKLI